MSASATTPEFVSLVASDFDGARKAVLKDVPSTATVGEVVSEASRLLQLPFKNFYQAVFRGRELNDGETIRESGLATNSEIELVPEVSAGNVG